MLSGAFENNSVQVVGDLTGGSSEIIGLVSFVVAELLAWLSLPV